jgi:RND family efflux transporter MFP subunit
MNRFGTLLLAVAIVWSGCVPKKDEIPREEVDKRPAVEVLDVGIARLVERGNYFGKLEPVESIIVSAEMGGEVLTISFDEGDEVGPGKQLLSLDEEPFRIAEEQATQAQASAAIRVKLLERSIELERKNIAAGIQQADAAVDGAKARLRLVEKGARSEEKKQARAGREAARAALESARVEKRRMKSLFDDGAATQQMLDGVGTQLDSAEARFDQAEQVYRLTVKGAREEDKDATRAGVKQAEATLLRATAAEDSLAIREQELEAAKVQVVLAGLQLEQAQFQRRKAIVESPLESPAMVAMRNIDKGETAAPGMPLFELLVMDKMVLELQIPSRDIRYLKKGLKVQVKCVGDAPEVGERKATVSLVGIKANPQNTTFPVELEIDNGDKSLRVGQLCEAYPGLDEHNLPLVPRASVLDTEEGKVVMTVTDSIAREAPVELQAVRSGMAAVKSGIEAGAQVIIVGERLVKDGEEVNVVKHHPALTTNSQEEE